MDIAPAAPARLPWQQAEVVAVIEQTPRVKSFFVRPAPPMAFRAGQHVDVRLTAPDGYQAQRSYSIASAPETPDTIELVVERLAEGEVSPFFHEVVQPGDSVELRGPIGGHFVWSEAMGGPVLLVGGGSGVVPLMSILRHRTVAAPDIPMTLVYSARTHDDVIFRGELEARRTEPGLAVAITLSRETAVPAGFRAGRIDRAIVAAVVGTPGGPAWPRHVFVCGANAFVEVASTLLLDLGIPAGAIRTERYGGAG